MPPAEPTQERIEFEMITAERDPAKHQATIASLFAAATERNLVPVRWELGFFIHRDVLRAQGRKVTGEPWVGLDSMWGCAVVTSGLEDTVSLLCEGEPNDKGGNMWRLSPKDL